MKLRDRIKEFRRVPASELLPNPKNWRLHPDEQTNAMRGILSEVGIADAVLARETEQGLMLIDGHLRADIASDTELPVLILDVTEEESDKLLATMDTITGLADVDSQKLSELVESIDFDAAQLDEMLADFAAEHDFGNSDNGELEDVPPDIDRAEELQKKWKTERGQLWVIKGNETHRLVCGDATSADDIARLTYGDGVALCLTDPPYGVGHKAGSGKNAYVNYEDTRENLVELAGQWFPIVRDVATTIVFSPGVTNAWLYPQADWVLCWYYGGGQLRSSWGFNCWQPFLCYGKDPSLAAGHGGRPDAVDMNTPANASDVSHPCPKPLALWTWMIKRLSFAVTDVLLDPFLGSGTTMLAAEQLSRRCYGLEIEPKYCAVILQRMQDAGCECKLS